MGTRFLLRGQLAAEGNLTTPLHLVARLRTGRDIGHHLCPLHVLIAWTGTNLYFRQGTNINVLKSAENVGYLETNSKLLHFKSYLTEHSILKI